MKYLFVLLMIMISSVIGCEYKEERKIVQARNQIESIKLQWIKGANDYGKYLNIGTFEISGCVYVAYDSSRGCSVVHSGNCPNHGAVKAEAEK